MTRRPWRDPDPDPAGDLSLIWGDWRLHGLAGNPPPRPDLYADARGQHEAESGYRAGTVEREGGPVGLLALLSPEQRAAALAYKGPDA